MDVAGAVQMLLFDPEGAADAAVRLQAVPEGTDMVLKAVPDPGLPALELTLGRDMQLGAGRS